MRLANSEMSIKVLLKKIRKFPEEGFGDIEG